VRKLRVEIIASLRKEYKRIRRECLEYFAIYCMENTRVGIKLVLSAQIFDQNPKKSDPESTA
jgi:hypothetical protein